MQTPDFSSPAAEPHRTIPSASVFPSVISILGCGWLGLPLGVALVAGGFTVKGSTTSASRVDQLTSAGIQAFELRLNPDLEGEGWTDFLQADVLIVSIPPKVEAKGAQFHVAQIRHLLSRLPGSSIRKVLYISSTSVYPDLNREVTEEELLPKEGSNLTLLQAEALIEALPATFQTTILRCGGLMGYDRIPGKYFAGKRGLTTGNLPVNYLHRDDAIGVIQSVVRQGLWGKLYNVVAPLHPTRREIYLKNAADFHLAPPEFVQPRADEPFKIVRADQVIQDTAYSFHYPDPLYFLYQLQ